MCHTLSFNIIFKASIPSMENFHKLPSRVQLLNEEHFKISEIQTLIKKTLYALVIYNTL